MLEICNAVHNFVMFTYGGLFRETSTKKLSFGSFSEFVGKRLGRTQRYTHAHISELTKKRL